MLEKIFEYSMKKEKAVERVIDDENVNINHMIFRKGESLPEHFSNSNVYMIITNGTMNIKLNDQEYHSYEKGEMLNIPYNTKMNITNLDEEILEFFVVKSPAPKYFGGK